MTAGSAQRPKAWERSAVTSPAGVVIDLEVLNARRHGSGRQVVLNPDPNRWERLCSTPEGMGAVGSLELACITVQKGTRAQRPKAWERSAVLRLPLPLCFAFGAQRPKAWERSAGSLARIVSRFFSCSTPEGMGAVGSRLFFCDDDPD